MSAVLSESGALPATGSGPFSLVLAIVGVITVGLGGLLRRVSRRPLPPRRVVSPPLDDDPFDLGRDLSFG